MSDFGKFCIAFWVVVGLFLVGGFSAKISHKNGYKQGYSDALASIKPDTVTVVDTIVYEKPVEQIKWKDKLVYVPVPDSILVEKHDTTYIALQFEKKVYADSTYRAVVSGFQPELESISVYQKTAYITKVVPEYKYPTFALSPSVGGFIFPNDYGVGAGLELDFWLNRWEIEGGGGYYVSNNSRGPYGEIKVKYNLIRK